MEQLLMQVFERRDWVAVQVEQQADSYLQTLACTLLAAGHQAPEWLLPSRFGGSQQELNGKPIVPGLVFTGSQITTPAANRNVFFPPAVASNFIRKSEILNAYTQPVSNCASLSILAADEHEEPRQEQTSISEEFANTCAEFNMFLRIQRSKSRQRNIEDRSHERDQAANSGSSDGIQAVGSNKVIVSSSSRPRGDVANNPETTPLRPGQDNGLHASHGRLTDLECHNNLGSQGSQLEPQHEQTSISKELANTCAAANMFSRIQRSRSRQRNIEDHIHERDQAANSGTDDGIQAVGSNKVTVSSSSRSRGDVAHNTETTSLCPGQDNGLHASQGRLTDLECHNNLGSQGNQLDCSPSLSPKDHNMYSDKNSSARDLQIVPPPKHSELNTADTTCHTMPETHLFVEPIKLQFDGAESVCMGITSEQTGQQHEVPNFVGDLLLRTNTPHVPETGSKLSQTQEMGPLNSDQAKCSGRSHSVFNPLIEKDILQTGTKNLERSNAKVSVPPPSGPLQLADATFEANTSSGMPLNSLLGDNGHNHLSNLLTNSTNSRCSLGMSSVSLVQLPPQTFHSNNVYQSSPLSCGTHSNGTHFNGFANADTFGSAENMLPQDQHLLSRPSLEFDGGITDADAPLGQPSPDMHNEMLVANPASEPVDCHSGKLVDDVHVNKSHDSSTENKKDQFVAPKFISSVLSGRTRNMQERGRSSATPSEKCNGSVWQEGMEQEAPPVGNDVSINTETCTSENVKLMKSSQPSVQYFLRSSVSYEKNNELQADKGNARKRSVADGVQVNGRTTSKRKRIKHEDVTHSRSSQTNSLSANNKDGTGSHVATAENLSGRSRPSGRYLLRSLGLNEFISLESETKNGATKSKISVASDVPESGDASPKPINSSHVSNVAICNSSSREALLPRLNSCSGSRSAVEASDFRNPEALFQTNFDITAPSALPSCSNFTPDIEECCAQEENNCLEGLGSSVNISSVKHQKMAIQTDDNLILLNQENYSGTGSLTMLPRHALDQHGVQTPDLVPSVDMELSLGSDMELVTTCDSEDPARFMLLDARIPRQEGDNSVDCNNILPEFECFDVSFPLDSPTTEKRTYEALCDPIRLGNLSLDFSSNNKVNTMSGMHPLVATMSKKATSYSFSGDVRQYSVGSDDSTADIFSSCGFFLPSDISASCSSSGGDKHVSGENPLTPAVEKYSMGKLSARVGSVSEHMSSIPELSCFRIDEDSDIADENECHYMLPESVANQEQSGRTALQDITELCQITENSALISEDTANMDLTTETHSSKLNKNSGLKKDHNNKKPKESNASLVKKERKVSHSLNRLSKTEVTDNRNQRNTIEVNPGKKSKTSNIVANVASFIPFVKPKQSTTACVKKDVRVKALEAAEAAKRLEEKKQNEREMRKAAAKQEREKMKKEKESKQIQEQEQKKKRDADMATRKRQREEEERKEKERKRRCAEEARKPQKQPTERRNGNDEKDAHPKASDNKKLPKNLVEVVRSEVKPDERIDLRNKAIMSNNDRVVDERPAISMSQAKENIPSRLDESYVMTPYKDSDDEDDEEEASRRRKKLKPSWVREENLVKILFENQALDPREVFAQKLSFNLSDVLPVVVRSFK